MSALSTHPPSSRGPGSANDAYLLALKQIEEDREQHKQRRERWWVQAQLRSYLVVIPRITRIPCAYSLAERKCQVGIGYPVENEREATSDWNEGDVVEM